ncbi:MAG TPA: rhomboid family intramembrane serine protease [Baekduia sp.]|uniref:rhomboid family intramembrane serine protease n=1 Tax=Baekduia sp. TaxID=2600305 RepID=UPI002CBF8C37|nr:rhomboid family intramembrane serine protease [Baekduia sp.]HMJ33208.1 rhomboid family intramembrane serine protease [Baekduia sp.]
MFPIKDNIPTERFPLVTVALIIINCVVYLFLQKKSGVDFSGNSLDQSSLTHYSVVPYEITHWGKHCDFDPGSGQVACQGQPGTTGRPEAQLSTPFTVFTSMFTHGGLLHLAGNMLFLWIFGNNVEDSMGKLKFIIFYLLGGLAALGLQIAVDPSSTGPTLGASGAIAAVLGGYILLYPRARVLTVVFIILFFTVIEVPALVVLGIWIVEQVAFGAYGLSDPTGSGGGVAYFAHIGGFVAGLLLIRLFATRRNPAYLAGGPPRVAT